MISAQWTVPQDKPRDQMIYVYSGFRKNGMFAGSFSVGYFSGEPSINSEADAKAFAESRLGLDRVLIQVRTITAG